MSDPVSVQIEGRVALVTIDHPPANAISRAVVEGLRAAVAGAVAGGEVRALVITGAGSRFFAAGADVSEFPSAGGSVAEAGQQLTLEIERSPLATIAAINGMAFGGGCEIALACDLRFAGTTAELGITPAKLGLVYTFSSTRQLVTAVGPSFAKYILFSGERLSAEEALRVHLVDQLFDPAELEERTLAFASTVCSRSQVSVRGAKLLVEKIKNGMDTPDEEAAELPITSVSSEDYKEGVRAFLEKRPPVFRVR